MLDQCTLLSTVETRFGELFVFVAFDQNLVFFRCRARERFLQTLSENFDTVAQRSETFVGRTNLKFFRPTIFETRRRIGMKKISRDVRGTRSDQWRTQIDAADVQQGHIDEEFADGVLLIPGTGDERKTTEKLKTKRQSDRDTIS